MIGKDLLQILVCPEDRSPLTLAEGDLVERLNEAIAAGRLKNRSGQLVDKRLSGGLLRRDETLLYPIVDDIPRLLIDEGIPLAQL